MEIPSRGCVIKNHFRGTRKRNQAIYAVHAIKCISNDIVSDPDSFFSRLTHKQRQVLNKLLWLDGRHLRIYVSQSTIAEYAGITREHANRILLLFESLGIIHSTYRHLQTCLYKVSSFFCDPKIRHRLKHLFAALSFMPWSMYVCRGGWWEKRDQVVKITQVNNISSFYKSNRNEPVPVVKHPVTRPLVGLGKFFFRDLQRTNEENNVELCTLYSKNTGGESVDDTKDHSMSKPTNPIRESIRSIDSLSLTRWGQIELMQFPDEAIRYADRSMRSFQPKDPFKYFIKVCYDWCRSNNVQPDVRSTRDLYVKYNRPDNPKMLLSRTTSLTGKQFAYKVAQEKSPQREASLRQAPPRTHFYQGCQQVKTCTAHPSCLQYQKRQKIREEARRPLTFEERQKLISGLDPSFLARMLAIPEDRDAIAKMLTPDQESIRIDPVDGLLRCASSRPDSADDRSVDCTPDDDDVAF